MPLHSRSCGFRIAASLFLFPVWPLKVPNPFIYIYVAIFFPKRGSRRGRPADCRLRVSSLDSALTKRTGVG
jgi:hypothetical protein